MTGKRRDHVDEDEKMLFFVPKVEVAFEENMPAMAGVTSLVPL
jgi:hypothetical protein